MKRPNRDDNYGEWLIAGFGAAGRHGAQRKRPSEQLQHGPARGAVMLLGVIDDENVARRKAVLDRHGRQATGGEIVGHRETGHHRDAEPRHDRPFDGIRIVKRHRACWRETMPMPPGRGLPSRIRSFFAQ
jgi:hypothetical protein